MVHLNEVSQAEEKERFMFEEAKPPSLNLSRSEMLYRFQGEQRQR